MSSSIAKRKLHNPATAAPTKRRLIKVGRHYLDPEDIAGIKEAKPGLFIIKLKSEPNPDYPLWVPERDLAPLLEHFEIVEGLTNGE